MVATSATTGNPALCAGPFNMGIERDDTNPDDQPFRVTLRVQSRDQGWIERVVCLTATEISEWPRFRDACLQRGNVILCGHFSAADWQWKLQCAVRQGGAK